MLKISDKLWLHPVALAVGNEEIGAYVRSLAKGEPPESLFADVLGPFFVLTPNPEPRRLRELQAKGWATTAQIKARVAFYGGLCWICRTAPCETIDHVKPLAHGGTQWASNLRPACKSCNSSKGAKWPFQRAA